MARRSKDDQYSEQEAQRRLESALRGSREVGHKQMKDMDRKRPTPPKKKGKPGS